MRPAVPLYCRCTPTDFVPFLRKPVSSTTSTACSSPRCSTTYARRSSRTWSASQSARANRCCIPSGRRLARELRELPAVLALHGAQQPPHVGQRAAPRLGARKPPPYPRVQRLQPVRPLLHRGAPRPSSAPLSASHDCTSPPWYSHRIPAITTAVVLGATAATCRRSWSDGQSAFPARCSPQAGAGRVLARAAASCALTFP